MAELAEPIDQAVKGSEGKEGKYLTFSLDEGEYGIGILKIKEIIGLHLGHGQDGGQGEDPVGYRQGAECPRNIRLEGDSLNYSTVLSSIHTQNT